MDLGWCRGLGLRRASCTSSHNRWNCWQKHVMNVVAGITWEEFVVQVVAHNPTLEADGYLFQAEKTYWLPEQAGAAPVVLWSRALRGFYGTRWACYVDHVRGKVEGIDWNEFVEAVVEFNQEFGQGQAVVRSTFRAAEGIDVRLDIGYVKPGQKCHQNKNQLYIDQRGCHAEHLGIDLVKLPVAAFLWPLAAKHGSQGVDLEGGVGVHEVVLDDGADDPGLCRALPGRIPGARPRRRRAARARLESRFWDGLYS